jgi:hypothetical protein
MKLTVVEGAVSDAVGGMPAAPRFEREGYAQFVSGRTLQDWARATFIEADGPLFNPEHKHLKHADVLFVWSSWTFKKSGMRVVGTAQRGEQSGSAGKKELLESFYCGLNGGRQPDFVVTLCAPFFAEVDPVSACAVIEHVLTHCGHAKDCYGHPMYFRSSGLPKFTLRGHDVEEFIGVVKRYGAYDGALQQMKDALNSEPSIARAKVEAVCGCGARF